VTDDDKRPTAQDAKTVANACGTHQFSLRALLWFAVLCSLWCSQIPIARSTKLWAKGLEFPLTTASATSIFLAWAVLPFFGFRQRLYGILFAHLLLPPVGFVFYMCRDGVTDDLFWQHFAGFVLVVNCVSFPAALAVATWRWLDTPADYLPTDKQGRS
jgi:hypothetical protein